MFSPSNKLIGRDVKILVGEPWNFTSADGDNVVYGKVTLSSSLQVNKEFWIVRTNHPIQGKNGSSNLLLVTTRHTGESLSNINLKGRIPINGLLINSGSTLNDCEQLFKSSEFLIIGSIEFL